MRQASRWLAKPRVVEAFFRQTGGVEGPLGHHRSRAEHCHASLAPVQLVRRACFLLQQALRGVLDLSLGAAGANNIKQVKCTGENKLEMTAKRSVPRSRYAEAKWSSDGKRWAGGSSCRASPRENQELVMKLRGGGERTMIVCAETNLCKYRSGRRAAFK